jgi:hypothetical protein
MTEALRRFAWLARRRIRLSPVVQAAVDLEHSGRFAARHAAPPDYTLVSIYRKKNADTVRRLVDEAPAARVWALDGVAPELADVTVGEGGGSRFRLLNQLIEPGDDRYLVVTDDDLELRPGDLDRLVAIAAEFDLDLCQPGHGAGSRYSYQITRHRPFSLIRLTNFVEIGPLFVVSPRFRSVITPFPDTPGMGWGADVEWMAQRERTGARFAVVDAVNMRHTGGIADAYDATPEWERAEPILARNGITDLRESQKTLATVRPWAARRRR